MSDADNNHVSTPQPKLIRSRTSHLALRMAFFSHVWPRALHLEINSNHAHERPDFLVSLLSTCDSNLLLNSRTSCSRLRVRPDLKYRTFTTRGFSIDRAGLLCGSFVRKKILLPAIHALANRDSLICFSQSDLWQSVWKYWCHKSITRPVVA
jgi:hypothetical protein